MPRSPTHRPRRVFATLEDVLDFYDDVDDRRGRDRNINVSREQLDPLLRRLRGVDDDDVDCWRFCAR